MAYPQKTFAQTTLQPRSLLGRRRAAVSTNTLLYQLDVLKKTGRYDAFKLQWHPVYDHPPLVWPIPDHLFWDSDVAKWIEGACYLLKDQPNADVEAAVHELVEMIRSAQQPDGYLNIHYTVVEPGKRFTNLRDFHELYNCGHMIEAALAHQDLYQNDRLLEPLLKYVDLLCEVFGKGNTQIPGYPGHPEIELALLRLHRHTNNPKHLNLARFFLTERGNPDGWHGRHYYDVEAERRGDDPNRRPAYYPGTKCLWYNQAHAPIAEQESVEGHSVRMVYLLTAVADLVDLEGSSAPKNLPPALYRLWDNMVQRKMYVTGGIGAMKQWEGFGLEHFLPQGTDEGGCYSETCAAIGVMMVAQRVLNFDLDGRFADVMELCLFNAVLTAMSYDGKRFTYVNQLASSDEDLSRREDWFTVACCPPNMLRILGQIGGFLWTHTSNVKEKAADIAVHLYSGSRLDFDVGGEAVQLTQETNWPWHGDVKFALKTALPNVNIKLRIPGWARSHKLSPECPNAKTEKGYLHLPSDWLASNADFTLSVPFEPRLIASHPFTNQNTLALARGPIIYCAEDADNDWVEDHFKTVLLSRNCEIREQPMDDKESGDHYVRLTATKGASTIDLNDTQNLPFLDAGRDVSKKELEALHFTPYYFRGNRGGRGHMRVGLKSAP